MIELTPGLLARRGFADSRQSLSLLQQIVERHGDKDEHFFDELLTQIASTADPDLGVRGLAEIDATNPQLLDEVELDQCAALIAVLGASEELNRFISAHYGAAATLLGSIPQMGADQIRADIASAIGVEPDRLGLDPSTHPHAGDQLRIHNRMHLCRIAARDLTSSDPLETYPSISAELTDLADALVGGALSVARAQVPGHDKVRLSVIAMGKCGAGELNYISDVDVMYVAEPAGDTPADKVIQIGSRLAGAMARTCSEYTGAGTIWQVDAALRPEGKAGPLVRSLNSMLTYYRQWAKNWEFQALLKARPMAGDMALGQEFCEAIAPLVWTAAEREDFVAEARAMRRRVISLIPSGQEDREIKLGSGGLRDVEFSVQLLQLVHGRVDERLRHRATIAGLQALIDNGYIGRVDGARFATAYRFLRVLEHRIQLYHLRRTHLLPDDSRLTRVIARAVGLSDADELLAEWKSTRRLVQQLHHRVFYSPILNAVSRLSGDEIQLSTEAAQQRLQALGFSDPAQALNHISALTKGMTRAAEIQRQLLPAMLGWFASGPNPDNGLLSFRQISEKLGQSPWYLRALRDEGEMAQRLARLLASSRYGVALLQRNPDAVQMLGSDSDLVPRSREDLVVSMRQVAARHDDPAKAMVAVRSMRGRETFRIAVGQVLQVLSIEEAGVAISDLASATIEAGIEIAARATDSEPTLSVVALGRWGGAEMTYSSDADAFFVVPDGSAEHLKTGLAQATGLRKLLGGAGSDPGLEIDCDLRPEGRGGALVRSISSYRNYFEKWAQTWEAQAMLRASYGAGDADVVDAVLDIINPVRYPEGGLTPAQITEIRKLKVRVEKERQPRGSDPNRNTKLGPGGLADIEWAVQLVQLNHAWHVPGLKTTSTLGAIQAAVDAELIAQRDAKALRDAWISGSMIRAMIMLVRGKATDIIPTDARDAAAIGYLLGYGRSGASVLFEDYRRLARHASQAIERVFWQD